MVPGGVQKYKPSAVTLTWPVRAMVICVDLYNTKLWCMYSKQEDDCGHFPPEDGVPVDKQEWCHGDISHWVLYYTTSVGSHFVFCVVLRDATSLKCSYLSVECSSAVCSFSAIAAAVPPRSEDVTVPVIVLFTIVSSCVTDCNFVTLIL